MTTQPATRTPPKRADARRNIAAILEAATERLARDPDVSVNEIATAAGVGRVTLYGHFESRAALVAEVVERAVNESEDTLAAVDLSGDPRDALARLLETSWEITHRFGALVVAAENTLTRDQMRATHQRPAARVERLLKRGRREGVFRKDLPVVWMVSTIQSVVHGASVAVHRGDITAAQAPHLIHETVLSAFAAQ